MKSNWMDKQVSLYSTHADNTGRPATYREILLSSCVYNIKEIIALRKIEVDDPNYKAKAVALKAKLQCFTPAALLECKAKNHVIIKERTCIMQLDFDHNDISDYDVEELKQAVFSLPFIAFCGLSCSGYGFYALALISDPERLSDYAEHCFEVFKSYGTKPDESKGKKVENLRYISYDANMLIRENPEPLKITHLKRKEQPKKNYDYKPSSLNKESNSALVNKLVNEICSAQVGKRFPTVQKVAFTLGGLGIGYYEMKSAIENTSVYTGQEDKYLKCAEDCYRDGAAKPL